MITKPVYCPALFRHSQSSSAGKFQPSEIESESNLMIRNPLVVYSTCANVPANSLPAVPVPTPMLHAYLEVSEMYQLFYLTTVTTTCYLDVNNLSCDCCRH